MGAQSTVSFVKDAANISWEIFLNEFPVYRNGMLQTITIDRTEVSLTSRQHVIVIEKILSVRNNECHDYSSILS